MYPTSLQGSDGHSREVMDTPGKLGTLQGGPDASRHSCPIALMAVLGRPGQQRPPSSETSRAGHIPRLSTVECSPPSSAGHSRGHFKLQSSPKPNAVPSPRQSKVRRNPNSKVQGSVQSQSSHESGQSSALWRSVLISLNFKAT